MDYRQSLATVLRLGIIDIHADAHRSQGMISLVQGKLARSQYVSYLFMLWQVYRSVSALYLIQNPLICAQFTQELVNPRISDRSNCLSQDIDHILGYPSWREHSLQLSVQMVDALTTYLRRLTLIANSSPELLLAHVYVCILDDLSGGQYIKRHVKGAYQLDEETLSFYRFENIQGIKTIKAWFRFQ
jgi:heme oxygenase